MLDSQFKYKVCQFDGMFELYSKEHVGSDNKYHFQHTLCRVNDLIGISSLEELIVKAAILGINEKDIDFSNVNQQIYNGA